jgi:hypothetical protein
MPSVSQASVALTLFEILQMRIVRKIVMGDTTFEVQWNVEKLFQS